MNWRIIVSSLLLGAVTIGVLLMAGEYMPESKLKDAVLFAFTMPGLVVSFPFCPQVTSTGTELCSTYWGELLYGLNYAAYSCVWLVLLMVWQRYKRGRHK